MAPHHPAVCAMTRRYRDLLRLLQTEAESYSASVVIERTNGGHMRSTFSVGARTAFIIVSNSPSDWRVHRKVRADARRALRTLTT
jgi:hypothetical protein